MINRTLLFGEGLFETIRWKSSKEKLELHYKRLRNSAEDLGIPYPSYEEFIRDLEEATGLKDNLYVKYLLISKGGDYLTDKPSAYEKLVITKELKKMPEKVKLCISPYKRHSTDPICKHKTTSYLFNLMVKKHAKGLNFWDGLIINERGYVCETSTANLLFLKGSNLYTPAKDCGLLWGTTIELLKRRLTIKEEYITLEKIERYDSILLLNSLLPCALVEEIEKKSLKQDTVAFEEIKNTLKACL